VASIEGDADPLFLAPDDVTGQVQPGSLEDQQKLSGMPTGLVTSSAAPIFDMLRTMQSIAPPPNSIVPAFKTRWRANIRFSFMEACYMPNF
jgi:hypothetical protein